MLPTKIGKELFQVMSKINYFKFLFLFLLTSNISVVSQVPDKLSINLEKVDLKSVNDSIIKYKQINPQKALQYGFYALNTFVEDELSLGIVNTNYYLAEAFFIMGDNKSSFEYLSKSLQLYTLLNPNKRRNRSVIKPPWILVLMEMSTIEIAIILVLKKFIMRL